MLSSIKTILCCLGLLFAFSTGFATELMTEQPKNKRVNVFILETMELAIIQQSNAIYGGQRSRCGWSSRCDGANEYDQYHSKSDVCFY